MRIGFVQTRPVFGKKKENLERALFLIEKTEADLLVLPELFNSGYFFPSKEHVSSLSEQIPDGRTVRFLRAVSKRKKCALVFGMPEKQGLKYYNSSVYISPKNTVHVYRKLHLFYREREWFTQGNMQLKAFPFYEFKIGMMICFDWIFPEVCRTLMLKGADLICHPSNLVLHLCQDAMLTRTVENGVFTITANRIGSDSVGTETLKFTGKSQITGLPNLVLARAGANTEVVKTIDVDLSLSRKKNPTELNDLIKDRRPAYYKKLFDDLN